MAFTINEEQKIRRMLSAYDSRKWIGELPEQALSTTANGDNWWWNADDLAVEVCNTTQSPNSARISLMKSHSPKMYRQTGTNCYIPLHFDVAINNFTTDSGTSIPVTLYFNSTGDEFCGHCTALLNNQSGHAINLVISPYFGMNGSAVQFYGMEYNTALQNGENMAIGIVYDFGPSGSNRENILRVYKIA